MQDVHSIKTVTPSWDHYRVIHSKYPTENLFVADHSQNFIMGVLASDTSSRADLPISAPRGHLLTPRDNAVDIDDIRYGAGWGAVMASFSYPRAGRYSTDLIGAYYCADSVKTALKEWAYHTQKYWHEEMHYNKEVSAVVRSYKGAFTQPLLDVRDMPHLHTDSYTATQGILANAVNDKQYGILYKSVRNEGGECAAILRPPATTTVTQSAHYAILFDGREFTQFSKLTPFKKL